MVYRGILEGTYYPEESLYTLPSQTEGATITVNFGESFSDFELTLKPPFMHMLRACSAGPDFQFPFSAPDGCPEPLPVSSLAGEPPVAAQPAGQKFRPITQDRDYWNIGSDLLCNDSKPLPCSVNKNHTGYALLAVSVLWWFLTLWALSWVTTYRTPA